MDRKFVQDLAQRAINMQKNGDDLLDRQHEEGVLHWQVLHQHQQVLWHALNIIQSELKRFEGYNPTRGQARGPAVATDNVQKLNKPQQ